MATQTVTASGQPDLRFTCNSCQVLFRTSDLQRLHMKGDWHRYNIKRRMTMAMPPVSAEDFAGLIASAAAARPEDKTRYERSCDACQKTFRSENAYRNHISSQKHKESERAALSGGRAAGGRYRDHDEASSVVSSTFSLGKPLQTQTTTTAADNSDDGEIVDTDAEEEFTHVVEGLKKASIQDRPSPVKRPSNPRLSAAGQHKGEHPLAKVAEDGGEDDSSDGSEEDEDENMTTSRSSTPTLKKMRGAKAPEPSLTRCLFCNYDSQTVLLSAKHMRKFHGMTIPEPEYLVDLEGLLSFLQTRIRRAYECISCGKQKSNVFAVQTHMRDKAHCMIPYMTLEEKALIGDFYDFRSTYSDNDDDDDDDDENSGGKAAARRSRAVGGGAKLGAKRSIKTKPVATGDEDEEMEDDGWETESSESGSDNEEEDADDMDVDDDEDMDGDDLEQAVYYDDFELHLPSGRRVGHRAHSRYYRQNLRHYASGDDDGSTAIDTGNAIENGSAEDADNTAGNALATRGAQSAVIPRDLRGLTGVQDHARMQLRVQERKNQVSQQRAEGKSKTKTVAKRIGSNFQFKGRGLGV